MIIVDDNKVANMLCLLGKLNRLKIVQYFTGSIIKSILR